MIDLNTYLESLEIPPSLALKARFDELEVKTFAKGEFYVREGQITATIAFITKGKVRHYHTVDGEAYTRWIALAGRFTVSFKSFVQQTPSVTNLVCIERTELLLIPRATFYSMMTDHAEMRQLWVTCLEREMVKYEDRVNLFIAADAKKRYLDFIEHYPQHAREVPLKYIASMLGIQPRHLSRIRKELASAVTG